ncbi:MAG: DNA replication/repair protein RecF [Ardenticatenaceae bacterium]|nr:DNA replication/repair protein RecF [Ardenticatenaceae bacterium]
MVEGASQLWPIVAKIGFMHITHLSLTNFRNYGRLELDLAPKATLLHGQNAQGKTNLLEAIYYLATTRSPHADQDSQLLNWDAAQLDDPVVVGRLVAHIATKQGSQQLEMRLIQERKNGPRSDNTSFRREVLVNRRKVRLMDLLGHLRVVLFIPEDVQIITGSPTKRRRYLDITLCQIDPLYCRALSEYNKVLEQRNALLRQLAEGGGTRELLSIYDEKLVHLGSQVFTRRATFLSVIARETQRIYYEELTSGNETITLSYLPRLQVAGPSRPEDVRDLVALGKWIEANPEEVSERFATTTAAAYAADIGRGSTNVGPHRDDWRIWINGRNLSSYGSRGQQRSAILALKMAEIIWMTKMTGESPILLLDEVVAELDEQRRALLLHYVQESTQAILTATDPAMFTADFLRNSTSLRVANGRIETAS